MAKVKSEFTNYMVGIKNNINDNNCFINVCLQTILHFKDLRYILLDDEKFKIFNNSPNIMKQFILILSSYNVISENTPNNNDTPLVYICKVLSINFEYSLKKLL